MDDSTALSDLALGTELLALGILIAGFVAARLASLGVGRGLRALDERMARITTTDSIALSPRLIAASRALVFWLVLIFAVALALNLLGVGGISAALDVVIDFIPQALVAFAIVAAGHLLGLLARNLVTQFNDEIAVDSLGPRLLHGAFIGIAVVMGLQHIDVDITFITQLLLVLIAAIGGGLMLAFALGARRHVANVIARRELDRYVIGERIRVDDAEGKIVEIHRTGLDISTADGIMTIPAARFAEASVLRVRKGADND